MSNSLFYLGEEGESDVTTPDAVLENPDSELYFALRAIAEHVEDGGSFADAVELFGTDEVQLVYDAGELTWDDVRQAMTAC